MDAATAAFHGTPIVLAYAYGSRLSGRPRPDSDLDIGYYQNPPKPALSLREEMILATRLSEKTDLDVDLRNLADAPLELRGRILEEGRRVYCADEVFRVNLERRTLSTYHDYKDVFRQMHEERLRNLAGEAAAYG